MDASDAPNVTSLAALAFAGLSAALLSWYDRRRAKQRPEITGDKEASVVAVSFVDKRQMDALTSAVSGLHGELIVVTGHLAKLNERAHESEIVAAAVAKMREERL